ncbi:MAG: DUF5320 domain-containing protein [bacterium]
MPGGDGTGPSGDGPRTGWGLGYCSGGGPAGNSGGFRRGGLGRRRFAGDPAGYPLRVRARGRRFFGSDREEHALDVDRQDAADMRAEILSLRAELDRILERLDAGQERGPEPEE